MIIFNLMKKYLKRFNQSLANPKSFWIGIFMLSAMIFVIITTLMSDKNFNDAVNTRNPISAFQLMLCCIPGFFLLAYGIKPKSKMGKIGALLFKLYDLVFTWRR